MLLATAVAPGWAIDMKGRLVPLDVAVEPSATGVVRHSFEGPAKVDFTQTVFALEVGLEFGALPGTRVLMNDVAVDSWPIQVEEKWLLRVPVGLIRSGENELRLEGAGAPGVRSLRLFSLDGSWEDLHFEQAFLGHKLTQKAAPAPHPTQALVDALHYDLTIRLNHANTNIAGTVIFTGEVLQNGLTSFALDFNPNGGQMVVSGVDQGSGTPAIPFSFSGNFLVMTLPRTYNQGEELVLRITYAGVPATGGVFGAPYVRSTHGTPATPIIYTFSQPYGARFWWPSKDLPDDKAMVDLHIESSKPYITVSNGTLVSREDRGATEVWNYRADFQIPTYLVSICSTNYAYASTTYTALDGVTTMPIGHYVFPQNLDYEAPGAAGTLDAMEFFARTFGEYPFLEHKYTTATHLSGSGMEHTTVTSMPARDVGVATGSSLPGRGRRNVHELAHHWFGDDVTCRTFDHLWLNEGFATWCEALYYEDEGGIDAYHAYVRAWTVSDTVPLVNPNADNFAGSVAYRRGGMMLHMLRNVVGKEELIGAMRLYLERHRGGTVLTEDFQQALEDHTGEDLDYFFNQWVYQPGRPSYNWGYSTRQEGNEYIVTLDISQTQTSPMPTVYTMPIDIRVSDLNGNASTHRVLNNARTQRLEVRTGTFEPFFVDLDPDIWIYRNATSNAAVTPNVRVQNGALGWAVATANGFDVLSSADGAVWSLLAKPTGAARTLALNQAAGSVRWYQMRTQADGVRPSGLTNPYAYRPGAGDKVLIVEGYDRWATQGRGATHPFAGTTGLAISAAGFPFDTCDNALVENGTVALGGYDAVVWVLGEESTGTESFSTAEQAAVTAYLQGGGNLFVSGAEVAWDLQGQSNDTAADRSFLSTYLKATYAADDSNNYAITGAASGVFAGLSFSFDDGTAGIYRSEFPDTLNASGGSTVALTYGTGATAAVQFSGTFTGGSAPGRLIFLGFPFETIYPSEQRDQVMARALEFFGLQPAADTGDHFLLY